MHAELSMPKYGCPGFQDFPGQPDFPQYTVDIVSPELPCGAAWLASCLLELGIPLWRFWNVDIDCDWHRLGERRYRYVNRFSPWSRVIAGLRDDREFSFRSNPVPRFSHDLPGARQLAPRVLLFVRDPRDALYSQWRRGHAAGSRTAFLDWLTEIDTRWHAARPRAYLMDLATWISFAAIGRLELRVIRFEDSKTNPVGTLRRALEFLAPDRAMDSEETLLRVVELASFERLKQIESSMIVNGVFDQPINFRGQAFEYKVHFTEDTRRYFSLPNSDCLDILGYAPFVKDGDTSIRMTDLPAWLDRVRVNRETAIAAVRAAEAWLNQGKRPNSLDLRLTNS